MTMVFGGKTDRPHPSVLVLFLRKLVSRLKLKISTLK